MAVKQTNGVILFQLLGPEIRKLYKVDQLTF